MIRLSCLVPARALKIYRALGDIRGEAEVLLWIGCLHGGHSDWTTRGVVPETGALLRASGAGR
jgi:hypothetical protein